MWATIAIIFVSLLVGYIISNKEEKTLSETWREEHKNNAKIGLWNSLLTDIFRKSCVNFWNTVVTWRNQ